MIASWAAIKPWTFSWPDPATMIVKIMPAVEQPYQKETHRDGFITASTLYNETRLVGYMVGFDQKTVGRGKNKKQFPACRTFSGFSMAASYSAEEPDDTLVLVLGTPHIRLIRLGQPDNAIYQIVMRRR